MEGAKDTQRAQQDPAPEGEPRDDVLIDGSPTRCPFCHSGVELETESWVACQGCLARHHTACWGEGGGVCSACGAAVSMSNDPASRATTVSVVLDAACSSAIR